MGRDETAKPCPEEGAQKDLGGDCFSWEGSDAAPFQSLCAFSLVLVKECVFIIEK